MDRLTALTVFRTVAELGSFAEAGRRLGLSPPPSARTSRSWRRISRRASSNRTTRRLSLTEAGTAYAHRIAPLLDGLAEAT